MRQLIGPFSQILTLDYLSDTGPLGDDQLEVVYDGGILIKDGLVEKIGTYELLEALDGKDVEIEIIQISEPAVCLPGFVDVHTHICFGGYRAADYAMRIAGKSYLEIAQAGGGILDSVKKTRETSKEILEVSLIKRISRHLSEGVTTCEVKSGYGLSLEAEIKMLEAINDANSKHEVDLIATCLAAHMCPPEFQSKKSYLDYILSDILPVVIEKKLAKRVDIFVEQSAFSYDDAFNFLQACKAKGFDITIHADQFSTSGSKLASLIGAISADHLEVSTDQEIKLMAKAGVIGVALPGASLGLGMQFAPGRKMLDAGMALAIASDWNPGSAPMGDLLMQAAVFGTFEKITSAETFAAITFRAANALNLKDRGKLKPGYLADFLTFPCADYREILYHQGKIKPDRVWKKGLTIDN